MEMEDLLFLKKRSSFRECRMYIHALLKIYLREDSQNPSVKSLTDWKYKRKGPLNEGGF